eukprot:TRINITY_DN5889_c0_g1_i2.p1 TRINITY_DN5889_c0_g1~~TRINITY_DN5889_c0_g1_i2.p1  ORF type:complete len:130 (+),score=22.01 TRINITY_DN5889_c0_g1_i2:479-868(+)
MHNGTLAGFHLWRRALLNMLPDFLFSSVQGTTDSEATFMLFLHILNVKYAGRNLIKDEYSYNEMKCALEETMKTVNGWNVMYGTGPSQMNFVCSNGSSVVATRYLNHPDEVVLFMGSVPIKEETWVGTY